MKKNDMEVIVYKILCYLYAKMKKGARPEFEEMCWNSKLFHIPENYWKQIISELIDKKYVKGFSYTHTKDGLIVDIDENASITLEGREYLVNNSGMHKAKEFLGSAFEILLSQLV